MSLRCIIGSKGLNRILSSSLSLNTYKTRPISTSYTLYANHWDQDFKPGPYPKTEEERRKAAEKYNLPYEAYEPYPDDGTGKGDYPKMPLVSGDSKDPFYPYDFPALKRNFNEPIPFEELENNEYRYDTNYVPRYSRTVMFSTFFGVMGSFFLITYIMEDYKMFQPALMKQMPSDGPHYLFPGDKQPGSGGHH